MSVAPLPSSDMNASPSYMSFIQASLVALPVNLYSTPPCFGVPAPAGDAAPFPFAFAAAPLTPDDAGDPVGPPVFLTSVFHFVTSCVARLATGLLPLCRSLFTYTPILDVRSTFSDAVQAFSGSRRLRRVSGGSPSVVALLICRARSSTAFASIVGRVGAMRPCYPGVVVA